MKTFFAVIAAAILCSGPALAQQDHKAHHPDSASSVTMADMTKMTPEELHKHCAMVMGAQMQGAPKHDHLADKTGQAPARKPPTDAEMKAMHDKCAAVMAKDKKPR